MQKPYEYTDNIIKKEHYKLSFSFLTLRQSYIGHLFPELLTIKTGLMNINKDMKMSYLHQTLSWPDMQ